MSVERQSHWQVLQVDTYGNQMLGIHYCRLMFLFWFIGELYGGLYFVEIVLDAEPKEKLLLD